MLFSSVENNSDPQIAQISQMLSRVQVPTLLVLTVITLAVPRMTRFQDPRFKENHQEWKGCFPQTRRGRIRF
jgi:hypothetical protein